MPNRWAISSGNWSNSAIWNGGLGLPTASDDIWANGFNVFVDQDITARTLRNHPVTSPVIAAGGSFITTGSRTITCTLTNAGTGSIGTFTTVYGGFICHSTTSSVLIVTGSDLVNIVSDIMGTLSASPESVLIRNNGIVNITGSIAGYTNIGVNVSTVSSGTLNISGSIRGNYIRIGGGASSFGLNTSVAKTINIIGDVIGEAGSNANSIIIGASSIIDIKGNIFTRGGFAAITMNTGTSTLTITGSIYQQTGNASVVVNIGGTLCNVNTSGSISSGISGIALQHATFGTSNLRGPISSSSTFPGVIFSNASHILSATGPFYNVNNRNAVYAQNLQLLSGSTPTWTFDTETFGEQRTLYTQNFPGNFPSTSNVRQGTVFGDTNQFTGTVAIPSTGSVLKGVPVDNITGSASFTTQTVWSTPTSSLTASNSLGSRLRNTATVASDGILIALTGSL
jgi:hypothetical protein